MALRLAKELRARALARLKAEGLLPTSDEIREYSVDQMSSFKGLIEAYEYDIQYNRLSEYVPFKYQKKFHHLDTWAHGLIAGNRSGKSYSASNEVAMHLTGNYPDWWEGHRFENAPMVYVAGEDWTQNAEAMQTALFGTSDVKDKEAVGTGSIPRDNIDFTTIRSNIRNIVTVKIKHTSGRLSTCTFKVYSQGRQAMQGFAADVLWVDEQPPDEIVSELVTRTAQPPTGESALVIATFTPLEGKSLLYLNFIEAPPEIAEHYGCVTVGWDDVPEYHADGTEMLTKKTRAQLLSTYKPWEIEARTKGIATVGAGAVFPFSDYSKFKFSLTDIPIHAKWDKIVGIDFGYATDPTVLMWVAYEGPTDTFYVCSEKTFKNRETPDQYAYHLTNPNAFCPVSWPRDGSTEGRYTESQGTAVEVLRDHGVWMLDKPFTNVDKNGKENNHKWPGISSIYQYMQADRFFIEERCFNLLREMQNYHFHNETKKYVGADDHIDALRYAVVALLQGKGSSINSMRGFRIKKQRQRQQWDDVNKQYPQRKINFYGGSASK